MLQSHLQSKCVMRDYNASKLLAIRGAEFLALLQLGAHTYLQNPDHHSHPAQIAQAKIETNVVKVLIFQ